MNRIRTNMSRILAGFLVLLFVITAVLPLTAAAADVPVPAAQILLTEENGILTLQLQLRGTSLARTQCLALSYDTAALSLLCNDGTAAPLTAAVNAYDARSVVTAADGWSAGVMNTVSGKSVPMMEHGTADTDRGLLLLYPTADTPKNYSAYKTVLTLRFSRIDEQELHPSSIRLFSKEELLAASQTVKLMLCTSEDYYTFGARSGADTLSAPAFLGHPVITGASADNDADPIVSWRNPFTDITEELLYYDAIAYVAQTGLFVGNDKNQFLPNDSMNRATFATVLCRLAGAENDAKAIALTESQFTDVKVDAWYAPYVTWSADVGLFYGYGDNRFGPDDPITHEQMYLLMQRFTEMYGYAVKDGSAVSLSALADSEKIDSWAVDAVRFAHANDLLVVDAQRTIRPTEQAARWELAVLLQSLSQIPRTTVTASAALTDALAAPITVDETARGAVDVIVNGLLTLNERIDLSSYHLTLDRLAAVYQEAVKRPEFFYVDNMYSYTYNQANGEILSVIPTYTMRGTELLLAQKTYAAAISEHLSGIDPAWSDLEKIMYLHDLLAVRYVYDTTLGYFDVLHLITEGRGVCQGYTMLLQALLNALGIENDTVISDDMNHTWNLVKLNGSWFHVDVTWDDPIPDQYGQAFHEYFLKSDAYMLAHEHYGWVGFEDIACTDTAYDKAFFNDVHTPFVPASDAKWYYINDSTGAIHSWDLRTKTTKQVYATGIRWATAQGIYLTRFTGLAVLGDLLIYNSQKEIYVYDLKTNTAEKFHTKSAAGDIYGMTLQWSTDAAGKATPYIAYRTGSDPYDQSGQIVRVSAANLMTCTVSGTVRGYFSDAQTKITLLRNGTSYKTVTLPRTDGFTETDRTFTLSDIRPGRYDLVIEKKGCFTYTVKNVSINTTADLTDLLGVLTLLCGDINADGKINDTDRALLLHPKTFRRAKEQAQTSAADCNGDGIIDIVDYAILTDADRYGKDKSVCIVAQVA